MLGATGLAASMAILALTVSTAGAVRSAPATEGPTRYVVAADGSGDFASIQAAVDAAADGDTVVVKPGTYIGPVMIDKDLHLVGDGPRDRIVISASAEAPLGQQFAFLLSGGSVSVADLTVATPDRTVGVAATAGAPLIERVSFVGPEELVQRSSAQVHRPFVSLRLAARSASPSSIPMPTSRATPSRAMVRASPSPLGQIRRSRPTPSMPRGQRSRSPGTRCRSSSATTSAAE